MSELFSMCIQEEERLKSEQPDSAHVAITGPSKGKGKGKKFGKGSVQGNKSAFVTMTDKASSSGTKGNGEKAQVEAVGTLHLVLESSFNLDLIDTVYVPSMTRNLISVSRLHACGYSLKFENKGFSLFLYSRVIGSGLLKRNLYKLLLNDSFTESLTTMNVNDVIVKTCGKRKRKKENSAKLWHERLGHISRGKMERLIKDGILHSLDFSDFDTCIECVKGKFVKGNKRGATRSTGLLKVIHIDICGPFPTPGIGGHNLREIASKFWEQEKGWTSGLVRE
ncbi:hypothetical protein RJ639_025846 [Escallonia herrerae]|uniref:GAG-pre-integrase domain-containing protein n=1 Tax=Escallonia herrerae TaxID=1293975 RepID=A0AA88UX10_9ASTE|nr:hypothetical protein RJ639_025846 [Escallonia herrerae]